MPTKQGKSDPAQLQEGPKFLYICAFYYLRALAFATLTAIAFAPNFISHDGSSLGHALLTEGVEEVMQTLVN